MPYVLDLILVFIFIWCAARGYFRGFLKTVLGLGRLFLSVIICVFAGRPVGAWLDRTFFFEPFHASATKVLSQAADAVTETAGNQVDAFIGQIPDAVKSHIDLEAVDKSADIQTLVTEWSDSAAHSLSALVGAVLGFVLVFVVSFLVLTIVLRLVSKIGKLPVIGAADRILGLVVGLVRGLVAVTFLATILYLLVKMSGQMAYFEESHVFKFIYNLHFFQFAVDKIQALAFIL